MVWLQSQPSPADGVLTKSNRAVAFEADPGYDVPPRQLESLWEGLVPSGSGSVYITDAASFAMLGAPAVDSTKSPSEGRYRMAMFHQLHRLAMLKYVAGTTFETWYKPNTSFTPSHLNHCIDYLRQSIMCAGDVTLEPILPEVNNQGRAIKHQCRDFDAVQEFVNAHDLGSSPSAPV
ncbi:hypothetical protein PV04_08373 [Phialophora macrospora]|uniref:Uncharacterized protein n=1 Tax=Phialophora macrospora TaxID=1851006 RepID=A0A0D2DVK2_9EURO|nr:hypothetical protein PV04_08373 [Phialophora macrospora]